jgi:tripartite-type tricarboxylate transporter receptor subunit TctC
MTSFAKLAGAALLMAWGLAHAQSYSTKPLRIIATFTPGSTVDIMARVIATKLTNSLGWQVIVENRAGAGGAVGIEATARAPKDGNTIMLSASGLAIIPSLNTKLSWDPIRDFAPVAQVATSPLIIVLHPSVPAKSLQELIALAKAQPGKIRYGHVGIGTSQYMAGQLFAATAGVDLVDVPYKGNEESLLDLLGGRIEMNFQGVPTVISHLPGGKVRAIVVTGQKRVPALPDVPTIVEAGLPGASVSVWFGLLAPAGTSREIVDRLYQAVATVMKSPDVIDTFARGGSEAMISTPEEFARLIRNEVATWAKVIKQRGIKPE